MAGKETSEEATTLENDNSNQSGSQGGGGDSSIPNDIFSDKKPEKTALPLEEPLRMKEYAFIPDGPGKENANAAGMTGKQQDGSEPPTSELQEEASPDGSQVDEKRELTPEEQSSQAKQTVDLMLKGYEKMHALGRYLGKMDNSKLTTMHAEGKINLDIVLPVGEKSVTAQTFFADFNKSIDENIVVTEDFTRDIRPPLERICIKRKWFLSDELYVLSIIGEDFATKISLLLGLKKSANMVLDALVKMNVKPEDAHQNQSQQSGGPANEFAGGEGNEWKE